MRPIPYTPENVERLRPAAGPEFAFMVDRWRLGSARAVEVVEGLFMVYAVERGVFVILALAGIGLKQEAMDNIYGQAQRIGCRTIQYHSRHDKIASVAKRAGYEFQPDMMKDNQGFTIWRLEVLP